MIGRIELQMCRKRAAAGRRLIFDKPIDAARYTSQAIRLSRMVGDA